ncbi:hypothetical protein JCM11957_06880 [Caminibacter profundus]
MKLKSKIIGSEIQRRASPQTKLIDEKERRIPFILISKNNRGERYCCGELEYIEELDVNGARFDNLKTFFKDHDRSVDSAIGKIENVRVENGELKADVVFGSTPDAIEVFNKYKEGILTDVSVGYRVKEVEVIEKQGEVPIVRVTDFEIIEVSAVGVGFDKGATVGRSKTFKEEKLDKEKMQARLKELEDLKERNEEQTRELESLKTKIKELETREAEIKELQRRSELQELAIAYGADKELVQRFLDDKTKTKEDFMKALLDTRASEQPKVYAGKKSDENRQEMIRAMSDGLMLRLGFNPSEKHKDADMFRGMSVQNMVRKIAGLPLEASETELVRAMTTSDFPLILANVQNKVIQDSFESAPVTFRKWTQAVDFKDFKPRTEVRKGSFGANFKKVQELGKTEYVEKGETGITWRIHSYGARFAFTREMLINDDLGMFTDDLQDMIEQVAVFQNRLVYDLLQSRGEFANYVMDDGKPIFDAAHNNYDADGAALSTDSLAAARTKMMRQKDFDGRQLRILPKFLLVPPELEVAALQILNSTAKVEAQNAGVANPFKGAFELISDMELEDAKAWYLAAMKKTIKVGYLQGTGRKPIVEEVNRSNITGIEYELVFDFGVTAEDFRGLYKNAGA